MTDPLRLVQRVQELDKAATPGKWTVEIDREGVATLYAGRTSGILGGTHGLNLLGRMSPDKNGFANLAFIAEARQLLPLLAAAVERLTQAISSRQWDGHGWCRYGCGAMQDIDTQHRADCLMAALAAKDTP